MAPDLIALILIHLLFVLDQLVTIPVIFLEPIHHFIRPTNLLLVILHHHPPFYLVHLTQCHLFEASLTRYFQLNLVYLPLNHLFNPLWASLRH